MRASHSKGEIIAVLAESKDEGTMSRHGIRAPDALVLSFLESTLSILFQSAFFPHEMRLLSIWLRPDGPKSFKGSRPRDRAGL